MSDGDMSLNSGDGVHMSPLHAVTSQHAQQYYKLTGGAGSRTMSTVSEVDLGHDASIGSSVLNLSNTILGASTLTIAFACHNMGVLLYVVLLIAMGILAEFSIQLLTRSLIVTGRSRYEEIGYEACGRFGELLALSCVIVQQLGACIAYVDIIGDVLRPIACKMHLGFLQNVVYWQVAVMVIIIFPLMMLRKMDSLKVSSSIAVTLILIFAVVVTIDSFHEIADGTVSAAFKAHNLKLVGNNFVDIMKSIPVLVFAFVCHMNVFPIYQELKSPTVGRMGTVGKLSVMICFLVYMMGGLMGNLAFQQYTEGDLLQSFESHPLWVPEVIIDVVRFGIGLALIFSVPVLAFELRHGVDALLFRHEDFSWKRHTIMNVLIVIVSLVVAILVPTVVTVFSFIGATTSTLIVYVMPALFFLRITSRVSTFSAAAKQGGDHHPGGCGHSCRRGMAWFMLIAGCALIPLCLVAVTLNQVDGHHSAKAHACLPAAQNTAGNVTLGMVM